MTTIVSNLISAAHQAAHAVEAAAADLNTTFTAEQGWYGVEFEALVGGDWVRGCDLDPQQEADAEAVRLFDCDGERGNACRTVAALATEKAQWIYGLALSATEPSDNDDAE